MTKSSQVSWVKGWAESVHAIGWVKSVQDESLVKWVKVEASQLGLKHHDESVHVKVKLKLLEPKGRPRLT